MILYRPDILFFVSIVLSVFVLIVILALIRSRMGAKIFSPILKQPYGGFLVSKNFLLGLALLETPIILSVVIGIIVSDLISYSSSSFLSFLPSVYMLIFSLSAGMNIFYVGRALSSFLPLFAVHPQYESSFFMQLIVLSSSFQVPFIIFFVSIFYHKYYVLYYVTSIVNQPNILLFITSHIGILLAVQLPLLRGLHKITKGLSSLYYYYPENVKSIFLLIIVQIGFLQAPYIFSFIVFLLLFKVYTLHINFLYSLFSIIAALFAICGLIIIKSSSLISATSLKVCNYDLEYNKMILRSTFISQVFLDSRILYIFLIVLISINLF